MYPPKILILTENDDQPMEGGVPGYPQIQIWAFRSLQKVIAENHRYQSRVVGHIRIGNLKLSGVVPSGVPVPLSLPGS